LHPDAGGGWRTIEASIAPIRDPSGSHRFLLAVGHDVTDRVTVTRALRESEERYEALVANIPDVTWITERSGRTVFISPNVVDVLGSSVAEVCDSEADFWFSRLHPADADAVRTAFERLFSHGEGFDLEYRFKGGNGHWIWLRDRAMRTFERDGTEYAYGVFSDVTQRRSLEVQLQQAQKLDTLGILASGIAHDFNNLLVPLLGYADFLREGVGAEDPLRRELEGHVFDAVDRARELVRQILTFSRREEPERRIIHLAGPLKAALRLVAVTLPASITLRQRISEGAGKVLADGNQIQQVVLNLCTNAIHAMREKGGVLEVSLERVSTEGSFASRHPELSQGKAVRVQVRDTGEGMEAEVLERAFDPFFTTKKPGEGTGLGLSIAYGIIAAHGGVLETESRPGDGTTVSVFLPSVEDVGGELGEGNLSAARGSESVLFVDDQEAIRETGARLLSALGYRTTVAEGGREALDLVRSNPRGFDVVVSDYDMPEMTGTHLALELLEIRPDLPVLLITGSHPARVMEGVELGIRGSLMKPFTAGELGRAVRRALSGREEPPGR
jgi:PAS domain S-box-containing protein